MLLDSAGLYFRAFYGVPDSIKGPNGQPNNAIRGFFDMLARLVQTYEPSGLVACLDYDWRPAFRVAAIATYKAHRVAEGETEESPEELTPQVPVIVAALRALGICTVGAAGYEADDVIGTLATVLPGGVDAVTGDRDLFQLVDDERNVRVLYTARGIGNLEIVTDEVLVSKYGVHGYQYVDFSVLRGDASDGLPGIAGIGEKTAATLINHYGDLGALREAAALDDSDGPLKPRSRINLNEGASYLDAAPTVVNVVRNIPLEVDPALPLECADPVTLDEIAKTWGTRSSFERVAQALNLQY
ncbi:MAG: 5'-3' exonuclease [Antricoccus sp.]